MGGQAFFIVGIKKSQEYHDVQTKLPHKVWWLFLRLLNILLLIIIVLILYSNKMKCNTVSFVSNKQIKKTTEGTGKRLDGHVLASGSPLATLL